MRILFVSELASIHAARWVNQFAGEGWDLHVFQGAPQSLGICPEFRTGILHTHSPAQPPAGLEVRLTTPPALLRRLGNLFPQKAESREERWQRVARALAKTIRRLKPDLIHSLGLNINWKNMMLPVLEARRMLGGLPAPWIYSSWGADLTQYAVLSESNASEVRSILAACDYHFSECERDARLARGLGFRGELLGILPAYGGITWDAQTLSAPGSPARRRIILLKGRDVADGDPQGRALQVLEAFERCREELQGYRVVICHAGPGVSGRAAVLAQSGLDVQTIPHLSHAEWLGLMGQARVFVAATVADGLPGVLVESMSLGALPVHSGLESIREWVTDGENGLLIPPEDPQGIAAALRRALGDDDLVERAARLNREITTEKLSARRVKTAAVESYQHALKQGRLAS